MQIRFQWCTFIDTKEDDGRLEDLFNASVLHWRAFKRNKEADKGLHLYETLIRYVLQWRAFIDNKEEDKRL